MNAGSSVLINMIHAWISSKKLNYYKWEALISFLGEKERKKHVGGREEKKKKKIVRLPGRALHAFPAFQYSMLT